MDDKTKTGVGAEKPAVVKALLCFGLGSMAIFFGYAQLFGAALEVSARLALNLLTGAGLWFLIGLAINAWAKRSKGAVVPAGKIALGFVALVALDQVARAMAATNLGAGAPILGDWLAFNFAADARGELGGVLNFAFPSWLALLLLPVGVIGYRALVHGTKMNRRLLALFVALYSAGIFSAWLGGVIHGSAFTLLSVGGFMSLGWIDLYHFAFIPLMLQIIFFEKASEEVPFREYFWSEMAVVKSLASGARKERRA